MPPSASNIRSLLKVIAGSADDAGRAGKSIRAYHGSPHNFSRFDASKIGSGEGAQAYGHGLYFAGSEDVAKSYRGIAPAVPSDAALESLRRIEERLQKLRTEKSKLEFALEDAAEQGGFAAPGWGDIKLPPPEVMGRLQPQLKAVNDELNALAMEQMQVRQGGRGHMYEVDLGVPEEALLDWDAPIAQQQGPIRKNAALLEMAADEARNNALQSRAQGRYDYWLGIANDPAQAPASLAIQAGNLRRPVGASRPPMSPREFSDYLFQSGIPGIRYFDGNSRSAGQGTRNYVMFPGTEDRIRILRQYGLLAPIAAGYAMGEDTNQ
jgi:hypothetical protein